MNGQLLLILTLAPIAWAHCGFLCYRYERNTILLRRYGPWRRADRVFCLFLASLGPIGLAITLVSSVLTYYCVRRGNAYLNEPVDW